MNVRHLLSGLCLSVFSLAAAAPALALANRVFVSQRSGNNANSCDNILTPCQTFAGAVLQLNPGGEAIVLDSGGYGPVTITKAVTIEAPAGVTAFIHPPSGDAITINAGSSDVVTVRGLVLNGGAGNGITVTSVGTLNVEGCLITGFTGDGIQMISAGRLNLKAIDVKACSTGVLISATAGLVQASVDHCHFDGNGNGYFAETTSPGSSATTATNSTANSNSGDGWICGGGTTGVDVLNLEFCTGSENGADGLFADSLAGASAPLISNCVFTNNTGFGVGGTIGVVYSRGNNTFTNNSIDNVQTFLTALPPR